MFRKFQYTREDYVRNLIKSYEGKDDTIVPLEIIKKVRDILGTDITFDDVYHLLYKNRVHCIDQTPRIWSLVTGQKLPIIPQEVKEKLISEVNSLPMNINLRQWLWHNVAELNE